MNIAKEVLRPVVRRALRLRAKMMLSGIGTDEAKETKKIVTAITEAIDNELRDTECQWIDKIEKRRAFLEMCEDNVAISDFGAGDSEADRDRDVMYAGVTKRTTVGQTCKMASKPYFWSLMLFKMVRLFRPKVALELGTCLGISGAYQAAAQKLNGDGTLITLEGSEALASLSKDTFKILGLDNVDVVTGRFQDTLSNVLKKNQPIDYAFIDGHHDEQATLEYFEMLVPYLSPISLVVFDDISWSAGMRRAWQNISCSKGVTLALDLGLIGVCVLEKGATRRVAKRVHLIG